MKEMAVVILAAGQGTRMKSDKAKVLHELCGRPLICHVIDCARPLGAERIVVIVGHQADEVKKAVAENMPGVRISYALQTVRLGTGHAVMAAKDALEGFSGDVLILSGDVPLLRTETLEKFIGDHGTEHADLSVLTFNPQDPQNYGRIIRGPSGELLANVEKRDASPEQLAIREVNSGIYIVDKDLLFRLLSQVKNENDQKEYYLTDIIALAVAQGRKCRAQSLDDPAEAQGINTIEELVRTEEIMKRRTQ